MFRTLVSLVCAIAISAPAAALAGEWHDRGSYNRGFYNRGDYQRTPTIERVRTIDFDNRNRSFGRRDVRGWERRDAERERYWRDRRDYRRDRYSRPSIIIIPHLSF